MTTVLVTGAAGFIGSHVVGRLLSQGMNVLAVDDLSAVKRDIRRIFPSKRLRFVKGDIRNAKLMNPLVRQSDHVIHEACRVLAASGKDPRTDLEVNARGTLEVLELCRKHDIKSFVYASSASVYGNPDTLPVTETGGLKPSSFYAVSKLAGENYSLLFHKLHGMRTVALRYFNVYGPRQNPHSLYGGVIPIFCENLLSGRPLRIYGDGTQTRDFTYVADVADVTCRALNERKGFGQVFNIGSGRETSVNALAQKLITIHGKPCKVYHVGLRDIDNVRCRVANIQKAQSILGYRAKIDLSSGLQMTYLWHRKHLA